MALKKPSDLFGKKSEENEIPIVESDNSFREELTKVESLSEQITQLQQELSQKVVQTDLEKLVLSQISSMQENFEYLQNDFSRSNKKDIAEFKERVSELTDIVGNLVENELPKYKKYVTKNEVRIGEKFDSFKESIKENIGGIKEEIDTKINDIAEVIDNNIEYFNNQLQETSSKVKNTADTYNKLSKIVEGRISKENEQLEEYSKVIQSLHESFVELQTSIQEESNSHRQNIEEVIEVKFKDISLDVDNKINSLNEDVINVSHQVSDIKADIVINEQHIKNVDKYLQEHHQELIELREEVFTEIEQIPVGNLQENIERLEKKIDYIKETYSKIEPESVAKEIIQEGLLNEPPETKNEDPLTPLNQNFVTIDQLQEHYRLFINRIQQQLSTLGGGGETRLEFLDDIDRNSAKINGRFLKYDAASGKWIGALGGGGSQTLDDTLGLGNTSSIGMSVGVLTATSFYGDGSKLTGIVTSVVGLASEGYVNNLVTVATNGLLNSTGDGSSLTGIVTSITAGSGISINQSTGNVTITATGGGGAGESYWTTTTAGIHTLSSVGIGTTAKSDFKLYVEGNAKVTGILTVGNQSVTINGSNNTIKVGSGVTIDGNTGIISASAVYIGGSQVSAFSGNYNDLTNKPNLSSISVAYASTAGISTYATSAGIATYASTAGIATYASSSGIATYASTAGVSTYASSSGIATYASTAGIATYATTAGIATYASTAGIATYASTAGIATYATTAGVSTYASSSGIATYASTAGLSTYASTAGVATALQNARTFEITGDVVASSIIFDGTGNVSLAATIQPNSVALGTDTTGDYVQSVSGTANQITVTSGTGEGSAPTLSIPSQFTAPQDVEVTRDLQVNRNLNVNGNITIGGTSATLFTTELKVYDPDLVLGFRTDSFGNDVSTDNTANHGGIAIASTEGNPLVQLFIAGIETTPATYKKIMWFKSGEFSGLGTDAWLSNYAVGIGSTQFPSGTRLAAGSVQFTERDLAVVRNINASGIVTATTFVGALTGTATSTTNIPNLSGDISSNNAVTTLASVNSNVGTYGDAGAIPSITVNAKGLVTGVTTVAPNNGQLSLAVSGTGLSGSATFTANQSGSSTFTVTSNATDANTSSTIVARDASGNFSAGTITANLTGTATTATNLADAANITTGTINSARLSGTYNINVSYASASGIATYATSSGIATYASTAGVSTYSSSAGIATYAPTAGISTVSEGLTGTPNITVGVATATSFVKSGGTSSQFLKADGSVDTSTYLTTTGSGTNLTGIVTSIVAGTNVTISGSTGQVTINATGGGGSSGVVIQDQGSTVGTATTINFSTNLTASFSGGVATVTATGGGAAAALDILEVMMFS